MSTETGKSVKLMISMPSAIYEQLEALSQSLGASKSKIVQQAIISMVDQLREAGYALDKDVSSKMFEG